MLYLGRHRCPLYKPEDYHGGYQPSQVCWITIAKVYPPYDLVISSMLRSYGIPFRMQRREVSQLPVIIGPLAEVEICVPDNLADEARILLEGADESVKE